MPTPRDQGRSASGVFLVWSHLRRRETPHWVPTAPRVGSGWEDEIVGCPQEDTGGWCRGCALCGLRGCRPGPQGPTPPRSPPAGRGSEPEGGGEDGAGSLGFRVCQGPAHPRVVQCVNPESLPPLVLLEKPAPSMCQCELHTPAAALSSAVPSAQRAGPEGRVALSRSVTLSARGLGPDLELCNRVSAFTVAAPASGVGVHRHRLAGGSGARPGPRTAAPEGRLAVMLLGRRAASSPLRAEAPTSVLRTDAAWVTVTPLPRVLVEPGTR